MKTGECLSLDTLNDIFIMYLNVNVFHCAINTKGFGEQNKSYIAVCYFSLNIKNFHETYKQHIALCSLK
jgi:hypothetical protein